MDFSKIELGSTAKKIMNSLIDNFNLYLKTKQNKLFIQEATPDKDKTEPDDIWIHLTKVIKKYTVNIVQSPNELMTLTINNGQFIEGPISVVEGTEYSIEITVDEGYTAGTVNVPLKGTIQADTTIVITPVVKRTFMLNIIQSDHQTITVTANNKHYTTSVELVYGTKWTAEIESDPGYTAGTLSAESGTMYNDYTLSASPSTAKIYTFTIVQSEHQTITVLCNGVNYNKTFTTPYGSQWTATITPEAHYTAGKLSGTSGTITQNYTLSASAAALTRYNITITQVPNQTIKVISEGTTYTTNFKAVYGTQYTLSITPDAWFNAGKLTINGAVATNMDGEFIGDTVISASAASKITRYEFTIGFAAQWGNDGSYVPTEFIGYSEVQNPKFGTITPTHILDTLMVQYGGGFGNCAFYSNSSVAGLFKYFNLTLKYGDDTWWILKNIPNSDFTQYGDLTTYSPLGKYKDLFVSLIGKEVTAIMEITDFKLDGETFAVNIVQVPNNTITVEYQDNSSSQVIDYTNSFIGKSGAKYNITINADEGYTLGTLIDNKGIPIKETSGLLGKNMYITSTTPTKKTYTFTIVQTPNQTIVVTINGKTHTETFTVTYGDAWTAAIVTNGYNAGELSASSGTITGDYALSATPATPRDENNIIINQSNNSTTKVINSQTLIARTESFKDTPPQKYSAIITPNLGCEPAKLSINTTNYTEKKVFSIDGKRVNTITCDSFTSSTTPTIISSQVNEIQKSTFKVVEYYNNPPTTMSVYGYAAEYPEYGDWNTQSMLYSNKDITFMNKYGIYLVYGIWKTIADMSGEYTKEALPWDFEFETLHNSNSTEKVNKNAYIEVLLDDTLQIKVYMSDVSGDSPTYAHFETSESQSYSIELTKLLRDSSKVHTFEFIDTNFNFKDWTIVK